MRMKATLLLFVLSALATPCFSNEWYLAMFSKQVEKAVEAANNVLETTRKPQLFTEADHTWDDKYLLAEYITSNSIVIVKQLMEKILSIDDLRELDPKTTLRFEALRSCDFLEEKEHKIVASESEEDVVEIDSHGEESSKNTQKKIYTTVTEYHWRVSSTYKFLSCATGNCTDNPTELVTRTGSTVLITRTKASPSAAKIPVTHDINLAWLQGMLSLETDDKITTNFKINRDMETCRTPSRNDEMLEAFSFFTNLVLWAGDVRKYFRNMKDHIVSRHKPVDSAKPPIASLGFLAIATDSYLPLTPMFENGTVPDTDLVRVLFNEFSNFIDEQLNQIKKTIPEDYQDSLMTYEDVRLNFLLHSAEKVKYDFYQTKAAIEENLKVLMRQAIGKEIGPKSFDEFMRFYKQKFFGERYSSAPFSHAIRRPEHYPDGILSIEDSSSEPFETLVRYISGDMNPPISIPINAATSVQITGDRYLHGLLLHRFLFSDHSSTLAARARQFSSFLLVIGNMAGPDEFKPKHAIIIKNKDELLIPLLMDVLPSAKEFKEAISSLSPEQQAFAKEFRGMQLESSVFAVAVIQIKPQLEKLLGLTEGALLKEIQLSEQLMSLFIEYQIPSDLLSFDGPDNAGPKERLQAVKDHVKAVMDVIDDIKEAELREESLRTDMRAEKAYARSMNVMYSAVPSSMPSAVPSAMPSVIPSAMPSAIPSAAPSAGPSRVPSPSASFADGSRDLVDEKLSSSNLNDQASSDAGSDGKASSSDIPQSSLNDFTLIPKLLDHQLEKYDKDGALRTTVIKASGDGWTRKRQENLLSPLRTEYLSSSDIETENHKAMDLLDALSRSGTLPINASELHVIIGVTHWFENTIIGTLVEENINPIEKVERSLLMLGSAIYGEPPAKLVAGDDIRERLTNSFPALLESSERV